MKILITGVSGFVGSAVCRSLLARRSGLEIFGIDNLMRPGSEINRLKLRALGVRFFHGDMRMASDFDSLPPCDWVIDAAANPSVLAGIDGSSGSRQLFEHNVSAFANVLEYCKRRQAGLCLLSTSRVYSIPALAALPLKTAGLAFALDASRPLPTGVSEQGIDRHFSTAAPISLYGSTKLVSETLALEYGMAFDFPVWITRCGVLAGEGQFGTPDQGIFSYWIHSYRARRPLKYIGFEGTGRQVRDAFHPADLAALLDAQMSCSRHGGTRLYSAGGGPDNAMSLAQLSAWCNDRFGNHQIAADLAPRPYDLPWIIMEKRECADEFNWKIETPLEQILERIAGHAATEPAWLELSRAN